jgi:hypothetical protein
MGDLFQSIGTILLGPIIGMVLGIFILWIRIYFANRKLEKIKNVFSDLADFKPSYICESDISYTLAIDNERKVMALFDKKSNDIITIFHKDIISILPKISYDTISEKEHNPVGAIIGGATGGVLGAMIGSALSSAIRKDIFKLVVKQINLEIVANIYSDLSGLQKFKADLKLYEIDEEGTVLTSNFGFNSYSSIWDIFESLKVFPGTINEEVKEIIKYNKLKENLILIHEWIKVQKESLVKNLRKKDIINSLNCHCINRVESLILLDVYLQMYNLDLLEELTGVAPNDSTIREYLFPFIKYMIVGDMPPYSYITGSEDAIKSL